MSTDHHAPPHHVHPLVIDDNRSEPNAAPSRGCLSGLLGWLAATVAAIYAGCAVLWLGGMGEPGAWRIAGAVVAGWVWLRAFRRRGARALLVVAALAAALVGRSLAPRADRDWIPAHAHQAWLAEGSGAVLHDVRDFGYAAVESEPEQRWKDVHFDVSQIVGVDFVLVRFGSFEGMAHTMVSFELEDGRFVSISPEARYEQGEGYSPLWGMFRQYELIYVVGLERDVLGVRTNVRGNDVYVYRLDLQPETAQRVFMDMMQVAGSLLDEPRWYHTITTSCASTLVEHYERTSGERLGFDVRALLPGFSDQLVAELGLLGDVDASDLESMRASAWVTGRAANVPLDDPGWSARMRGR